MKFYNIRLLVNDFDKSFLFYTETLELKCTWGDIGGNFAIFSIGINSSISISKEERGEVEIKNIPPSTKEIYPDKISIIIQVDNVNQSYLYLKSKGVNFISEPKEMLSGEISVVHFRDPENNLFELFSEIPKTEMTEEIDLNEKYL